MREYRHSKNAIKEGTYLMKDTTKIYLSKQGMKDLKKKIAALERSKKLHEAELRKNDVRDDSVVYAETLARIDGLRADIAEKKFQLSNSKVLPSSHGKRIKVALGSFVELLDRATGKIMRFQLVESIEADPSTGRISAESPLGRSLVGRKVDDEVNWTSGFKNMQMQLVRIG